MVPVDRKHRQSSGSSIRKSISRSGMIPHMSEESTYARRIQRYLYPPPRPRNVAWGYPLVLP